VSLGVEPSAFISYSHADQKWLDRLNEMLVPLVRGGLHIWSDQQIKTGDDWRQAIEDQLSKATVAVLLVSPKFIASDFIHKQELPPLLEAARQRGLRVLWVPISDSLYERTPIGTYQAAYPPKRPLRSLKGRAAQDKALKLVALEIEKALTQPPTGSPGNSQANPKASLGSRLAGLDKPESSQQPLASIRKNHEHLPQENVIKGLAQAIARCYPGQSLSDRFPDFAVQGQPNSWDALEEYFADGKGIDAQLLLAWEEALQDAAPAESDAPATVALVVADSGTRDRQSDSFHYAAYRFAASSQSYQPLDVSGTVQLDLQNPDAAVATIGAIIDEMLSACRTQQLSIGCMEIFAPWQLIAADWIGNLNINDDLSDLVPLIDEIPFLVRSADRLRMTNRLHRLGSKTARLLRGEGQWLPAATAGDPALLQVVDTQDTMVALHSHGPQRGGADAATWLKALLKSMVPLALWSMPSLNGDDMEEQQFFSCLWSLGLMNHGDKTSNQPQCPDLAALPTRRREAYPLNDCLRHLHLLIDTPHQPKVHVAQSPV
jgi:hypothetical protein